MQHLTMHVYGARFIRKTGIFVNIIKVCGLKLNLTARFFFGGGAILV